MSTEVSIDSGIRIVEIRIRNFRSLKAVDVSLPKMVVLTGENNSGKTSFLLALFSAIGASKRSIGKDDIFLDPSEKEVPKERKIIIDILIRPVINSGDIVDIFPEGSYWTALWGAGISQDDNGDDFMAFRTAVTWNSVKSEYEVDKRFLNEWKEDSSGIENYSSESMPVVSSKMIEPLAMYFMDAKRDIEEDLKHPGSFWRKLTSNLGLSTETVREIEESLSRINEKMVEESEILSHLKNHMLELNKLVASNEKGVEVAPIARRLGDLSKGIDLNFTTDGAQTFALSQHGMGTRSLASVLVFRAFMSWRQKQLKNDSIHSMLALEEPEAHLHPQAQRAIMSQINQIPGQIIVSTHSPYVVSQVQVLSIRNFRKEGPSSTITEYDSSGLNQEELTKINQKIMNTRGEILFARSLVFFEGETEEYALPVFAESYFGRNVNLLGISFIGVGGDGGYLPFIKFAESFKIPWFIFSDGEENSISRISAALKKIGINEIEKAKNVIILPKGNNWETYLLDQGYSETIKREINRYNGEPEFVTKYISTMHGQKAKKGTIRDYSSKSGENNAIADILRENKTKYSKAIAEAIVVNEEQSRKVPKSMKELFIELKAKLKI